MFCHQQCKVCILCLFLSALIAVPIYRDNAIRVLIDNNSLGIHAEGPHPVLKFFRPVHNFTLIELIRKMGKNNRGKLYAHADIHPV